MKTEDNDGKGEQSTLTSESPKQLRFGHDQGMRYREREKILNKVEIRIKFLNVTENNKLAAKSCL